MNETITVESYVVRNGAPISVDSLSQKEQADLAYRIKLTYLTELYRGQAEVTLQKP